MKFAKLFDTADGGQVLYIIAEDSAVEVHTIVDGHAVNFRLTISNPTDEWAQEILAGMTQETAETARQMATREANHGT